MQTFKKKRKPTPQISDDRHLQEGRKKIALAAADLFLSHGYHGTSVQQIARKARIGTGSIFNCFTSKEEILFFLLTHIQARTEMALKQDRQEFLRLKREGTDPQELFLLMYERYVRLVSRLRRFTVLEHQELKSLSLPLRREILAGEERIQRFFAEVIAYGVERGVFPPGDIDVKAHGLCVLAQSWAVRHWALRRFTTLEDYLAVLKPITLALLQCSTPAAKSSMAKGQLGRRLVQPLPTGTPG